VVTHSNYGDARAGATFWLASAMVGAAWLLAWYSVAHLPKAVETVPAAPPPESTVTSEVIAGASELSPPSTNN